MDHAQRLALVSLGLAACISTPADDESLLRFHGALQGIEGADEAAFAFTTDSGNALYLVEGAQGTFPSNLTFALDQAPPDEALYALHDGEPRLAFGYIAGVHADHPASVRVANSSSGFGGCSNGVCTDTESWCSEGDEPAQDVCYEETKTCDLNHENCQLSTTGDASLKDAPWGSIAGVSSNYAVLYLSGKAKAGSLTSLAFANGAKLAAGYHLLAVRARTEAEQDAVGECYQRSEQRALEQYNAQHGTMLQDPIDIPDDDYETLLFAAQRELKCPQTEKLYTPIEPGQQALTIQLARDEDALAI